MHVDAAGPCPDLVTTSRYHVVLPHDIRLQLRAIQAIHAGHFHGGARAEF